ncbi:MAG: hypothetical protein GY793_07495 [Proteobacteria bacterium]|nr:hypothetical protein [Pseudomonadota bacterium]
MRNKIGQFTSVRSYWNKNKSKLLFLLGISLSAVLVINVFNDLTLQDMEIVSPVEAHTSPSEELIEYKYNEQVPEDIILAENTRVANLFGVDPLLTEAIMRAEATCTKDYCVRGDLDNLAKNPGSTALGVAQYLIGTWQETESFKVHRAARTDYKYAIRELVLDVANGEHYQKWEESRSDWERIYKELSK